MVYNVWQERLNGSKPLLYLSRVQVVFHANVFHCTDVYLRKTANFMFFANPRPLIQHLLSIKQKKLQDHLSHAVWIQFSSYASSTYREKHGSRGDGEGPSTSIYNVLPWLLRNYRRWPSSKQRFSALDASKAQTSISFCSSCTYNLFRKPWNVLHHTRRPRLHRVHLYRRVIGVIINLIRERRSFCHKWTACFATDI